MEAWVVSEGCERRGPEGLVGFVGDCGADAVKVELELFGEDVLDEGLYRDVFVAGGGGGGEGVGGAFGGCFRKTGSLGLGGVLGDGGLDAFDCEPVGCGG